MIEFAIFCLSVLRPVSYQYILGYFQAKIKLKTWLKDKKLGNNALSDPAG